jgi:hypothetical protein
MTIYYKLTTQEGMTQNNTQWGENLTHEATGDIKQGLCSDAWIHAYTHPLLAVLMNPAHADIENPILWEGKGEGEAKFESLKCGFRKFTTLKKIPLPEVNVVQKAAFGILCAKEINTDSSWNQWADKWLSGEDRTKSSAYAAANAANAAAAYAAFDAAANAAYAAAYVAYAANAAANAADADVANAAANVANAAANAAKYAADAAYAAYAAKAASTAKAMGKELDFVSIALKAMEGK